MTQVWCVFGTFAVDGWSTVCSINWFYFHACGGAVTWPYSIFNQSSRFQCFLFSLELEITEPTCQVGYQYPFWLLIIPH